MFKFTETEIKDVFVIEPELHGDNRGFFMETYKESEFFAAGIKNKFVQDNQSASKKGVLRGIHFQKKFSQTKLVRVLVGEVFDVAVDFRKGSKTYGKWFGIRLSAENKKMLLIPKGFGHGFLVLSDYAEFAYKVDDYYHPEDEGAVIWNDPDLNIAWPKKDGVILSEKDKNHRTFREVKPEL